MDTLFLSGTALFQGIPPEEIEAMLGCLKARVKACQRGEVILRQGEIVTAMGMVLSGSISIESDDIWGSKSILDRVGPGQVFAETYACLPGERLMISAVAAEAAKVLFLDAGCMFTLCPRACGHHSQLIRNMLTIAARKSLNLSRRIMHTSSKTIRGRLLSFLSFQASQQGSRAFAIPFNRQQLADHLSVDRSALSNELSKMQREGILTVERNRFVLRDGV